MSVQPISQPARAVLVLHPLRRQILERARQPVSASEVASQLDLPRQKVNYHVRELAKAGFLKRAGQRRKGNMIEKRYVAAARSWVLDPALLGPLAARPEQFRDAVSAAHLLALTARTQAELVRVMREAEEQGKRVATLSMETELRFESAAQRKEFTEALEEAVTRVVARHASPARREDGEPGPGRPFRLVLGCHPVPPNDQEEQET